MQLNDIYQSILNAQKNGKAQFAVLIDPDNIEASQLEKTVRMAVEARVDLFLVGGSLILNNQLELCLKVIRENSNIPSLLFPGNTFQLSNEADGILLLSLISGRNSELLVGKHVIAAPYLKNSSLEIIPTGYMLIDGGVPTSVSYMSNTMPIPADKEKIAQSTAMAGEMLGLKILYLEAGSGAKKPVSSRMIKKVRQSVGIPIIVGGGIRTAKAAREALSAGANIIVIGNAIEKDPELLREMSKAVHSFSENYAGVIQNGRKKERE